MTEIEEGALKFSFPDDCEASKYDEWSFYRNQFQSVADGSKAVDMLCIAGDTSWLIEVKDYRRHPRTKLIDVGGEVASKVRDTLAGLAAASANANRDDERRFARRALAKRRWRVALHLEQPNVLRIDPHFSRECPGAGARWCFRRTSGRRSMTGRRD